MSREEEKSVQCFREESILATKRVYAKLQVRLQYKNSVTSESPNLNSITNPFLKIKELPFMTSEKMKGEGKCLREEIIV